MIILVMLVLFGGGYYGRALVVKQNLRGWTHDSSSPEGALVDAIFAWAKPDSGQKLFRSLEVERSVQRQGYIAKPNGRREGKRHVRNSGLELTAMERIS
jgi:hypothetical protein